MRNQPAHVRLVLQEVRHRVPERDPHRTAVSAEDLGMHVSDAEERLEPDEHLVAPESACEFRRRCGDIYGGADSVHEVVSSSGAPIGNASGNKTLGLSVAPEHRDPRGRIEHAARQVAVLRTHHVVD